MFLYSTVSFLKGILSFDRLFLFRRTPAADLFPQRVQCTVHQVDRRLVIHVHHRRDGFAGEIVVKSEIDGFPLTLGQVLKAGDASGYAIPFLVAGSLYGIVLLLAHLFLIPDLRPATIRNA